MLIMPTLCSPLSTASSFRLNSPVELNFLRNPLSNAGWSLEIHRLTVVLPIELNILNIWAG